MCVKRKALQLEIQQNLLPNPSYLEDESCNFLTTIPKSFKLNVKQSWELNSNVKDYGCIFKHFTLNYFEFDFFRFKFLCSMLKICVKFAAILVRYFDCPCNDLFIEKR